MAEDGKKMSGRRFRVGKDRGIYVGTQEKTENLTLVEKIWQGGGIQVGLIEQGRHREKDAK